MKQQEFIDKFCDLIHNYCYDNPEYCNIHETVTIFCKNYRQINKEVRVELDTYLVAKEEDEK